MKEKRILDAIGYVKDQYIEELYSTSENTGNSGGNDTNRKPKRIPGKFILIAAIIASMAITAFAYVGFTRYENPVEMLASFFGNEQLQSFEGQIVEKDYYGDSYTIVQPAIERVPLDDELAQKLVAPYIADVNKSVSYDGYTLTVVAHQYDSVTACGVIYYKIENPSGINGYEVQYDGTIWWPGGSRTRVDNCNGQDYLLANESTDTKLSIAHYYMRLPTDTENYLTVGFTSYLRGTMMSTDEEKAFEEHCKPITLSMDDGGGMMGLALGDGTIRVSPIAIRIDVTNMEFLVRNTGDKQSHTDQIHNLIINYKDGSEYVINGDNISNYAYACSSSDGSEISLIFNRLVDVEKIEFVQINGTKFTDGNAITEKQRIRPIPYLEDAQQETEMDVFDGVVRMSDEGSAITYQGYTMTAEAFGYDTETRAGMLQFRIENPNGFGGYELTWMDKIIFSDGTTLETNQFGNWVVDENKSSETSLHLTYCFIKLEHATDSLKFYFSGSGADVMIDSATENMLYYPLEDTAADNIILADGIMNMSPFGMIIDYRALETGKDDMPKDLIVYFKDGSSYTAAYTTGFDPDGEEPMLLNCMYLFTKMIRGSTENINRIAFHTVIDLDNVEYIHFDGMDYPVQ